ncbi:hypothetical protein J2Z19_005692 [Ensifer adhaerens]|uniref:Uncharacterized protein n=1 Tax=Ensifer adhaerens TaxID=106592 RepID=A0ACC5T4U2_ENSAD|nr:hypothetical protein [Ensifer adhaerens]
MIARSSKRVVFTKSSAEAGAYLAPSTLSSDVSDDRTSFRGTASRQDRCIEQNKNGSMFHGAALILCDLLSQRNIAYAAVHPYWLSPLK